MNPSERQQAMIEHLAAAGSCSYQDLAALLGVSDMTIRRDVDKLSQRGQLIKTLGGAQTAHAAEHLYESPIQQRLPVHRPEKEKIAREAMRQTRPQQTIFLDGSTTCLVLARRLAAGQRGLTVVSNSALVCLEFARGSENMVFSLGGQLDPASLCLVGPTTEEAARRFFVDIAFLSTKGFLPEEGTFESSIATIRIKQIIAEQAARVVLLVDHSKFGQRALCKALDIKQIHEVITDRDVTPGHMATLGQRGVAVRLPMGEFSPEEVSTHAS